MIALASTIAIAASLLSGASASAAESYWSSPTDVVPGQASSRVVGMDVEGDSAAALVALNRSLAIMRSADLSASPSGWGLVDILTIAELGGNVDAVTPAVAVSGNLVAVAWCDSSMPGNVAFKVWSTVLPQRVTVIDRGVSCSSFVGIDAATVNGQFTFTVAWASGQEPREYVLSRTYWRGSLQPVDEIWFEDAATDSARVGVGRPVQVQVGDTGAAVLGFVTTPRGTSLSALRIATRGAAQGEQLAQWGATTNLEPRSTLRFGNWALALGAPTCACYSVAWGTETTLEYRRRTLSFHAELASNSTPALAPPEQIHVTTTSPGDVVAWVERVGQVYFVKSLAQQFAPAVSRTATVTLGDAQLVEIDLSGNASGNLALAVATTQPNQGGALLRLIQSSFTSAQALWADPAGADVEALDGEASIRTPGTFVPTNVTATSRPRVIWTSRPGSAVKALSSHETDPRPPGKPTDVTATAGDAQATVTWRPPTDPGTSAVTGYTVTATPGGRTCQTAGALTCTVLGLTNGTRYVFDVTASNAVGAGLASAPSSAVVPGAAAVSPSEPRDVVATAGDGEATVTWQAPASAGSSAITGYQLISTPGDILCTTAPDTTECRVRGLTNDTEYFFTVRAINNSGAGDPAVSNVVIPSADPVGPPEPPTSFTAKAKKRGKVVLTWVASVSPSVTGYVVEIRKGSGAWRPRDVGNVTKKTFSKVRPGTRACYRVMAEDASGGMSTWTPQACVVAKR